MIEWREIMGFGEPYEVGFVGGYAVARVMPTGPRLLPPWELQVVLPFCHEDGHEKDNRTTHLNTPGECKERAEKVVRRFAEEMRKALGD